MKAEESGRIKPGWKRRTLLFLVSQCVTLFGSTLAQMAIVWYVTLDTGSGFWVAAFAVCSYLPQFLMSFVGGVWADRYSRKTLIIAADAGIAAVTLIMVLLIPRIEGRSALLGILLAMSALRSVGAGIQTPAVGAMMGAWGGFKSRVKTLLWGVAAFGALAAAMGLAKNFILYLALMLVYGVALTMVQTAATTLIQEKAELSAQGRVFGLMGSMYSGFMPLGMALFGPLADAVPLQFVMIGSGILLLLMAAVMGADKKFTDK